MTKLLFGFACLITVALVSCKTTTAPTTTTRFPLINANWDSAGTHGWNGWTFQHSLDTIDFELDAPPGGGTWGFKLHSVDFPYQSDNITQSFTNLSSGVYEFTLWSHTKYILPDSVFHPAWMSITKKSGGVATTVRDSLVSSLTWVSQSMFDTLTLLPTDTVTLEVSSGLAITHGNPSTVDDFTFIKLP